MSPIVREKEAGDFRTAMPPSSAQMVNRILILRRFAMNRAPYSAPAPHPVHFCPGIFQHLTIAAIARPFERGLCICGLILHSRGGTKDNGSLGVARHPPRKKASEFVSRSDAILSLFNFVPASLSQDDRPGWSPGRAAAATGDRRPQTMPTNRSAVCPGHPSCR